MRLAVSNLAWSPDEDEEVAEILVEFGVLGVELAPTKVWSDPEAVSAEDVELVRRRWARRGLAVVALQALLFGRSDLRLFGSPSERQELLAYLRQLFAVAEGLGARVLVFGSPRNRRRDQLSADEAGDIAFDFFGSAAQAATEHGVTLCIEPNPPEYGADFVTNASDGMRLVRAVGRPGFGLHLDAACMSLAGDDLDRSIEEAAPILRHFHASEPGLVPVGGQDSAVSHETAAAALRRTGYGGFVSVEMLPPVDSAVADHVRAAASFAAACYGDDD